MKPHLVKEVENPITKAVRLTVRAPSDKIAVKQADIDFVKRAMEGVVTNGTAVKIFRGAPYLSAGKTGTAQVYSLQGANYSGHATAEHLRDHALYIAFAPVDHPTIAVALIVENGGWGAESAGPIARKVLDYYLVDRLKPGAEAAAVAAAASATEGATAPVIGGSQSAVDAALPASVAAKSAAFNPAAASAPIAGASAALSASAASSASPASSASSVDAPTEASAATPAVPASPAAMMLRALATPRAPIMSVADVPRASGKEPNAQKEKAAASNAKEARKAPIPTPPKPPAPPKEPAPTAAIPRNNGKSPIQTLTPSGGIDE
jgi:penicillin-binding protein 2